MNLSEFQKKAFETSIYKKTSNGTSVYPALGLIGECGEVAEKVKKIIRDDDGVLTESRRTAIIGELGDCMWYLASMCSDLSVDMSENSEPPPGYDFISNLSPDRLIFRLASRSSDVAMSIESYCYFNLGDHGKGMLLTNFSMNVRHIISIIKALSIAFRSSLEEVCAINITKLMDRKTRSVINGDGDSR